MKKIISIALALTIGAALYADSFVINEKVKVVRSKPIYRDVVKRTPYQECWDEQVPVTSYYNERRGPNTPLGALIGGVAGGIIGHQVGGGHGKDVATVGGAILGTIVGNNLSRRDNRGSYVSGYRTVRKCVTRYDETQDRVITRYRNIAYYHGRKIVKISDRPLRFIHIRKIIEY
ncbi:MAG: glycine zipper 2TM domain-containing protein [Epsilonproteobacteria bacterium]|nr:glycine zipper 2TM domain-containing protein [Campylobacterota bacterium]